MIFFKKKEKKKAKEEEKELVFLCQISWHIENEVLIIYSKIYQKDLKKEELKEEWLKEEAFKEKILELFLHLAEFAAKNFFKKTILKNDGEIIEKYGDKYIKLIKTFESLNNKRGMNYCLDLSELSKFFDNMNMGYYIQEDIFKKVVLPFLKEQNRFWKGLTYNRSKSLTSGFSVNQLPEIIECVEPNALIIAVPSFKEELIVVIRELIAKNILVSLNISGLPMSCKDLGSLFEIEAENTSLKFLSINGISFDFVQKLTLLKNLKTLTFSKFLVLNKETKDEINFILMGLIPYTKKNKELKLFGWENIECVKWGIHNRRKMLGEEFIQHLLQEFNDINTWFKELESKIQEHTYFNNEQQIFLANVINFLIKERELSWQEKRDSLLKLGALVKFKKEKVKENKIKEKKVEENLFEKNNEHCQTINEIINFLGEEEQAKVLEGNIDDENIKKWVLEIQMQNFFLTKEIVKIIEEKLEDIGKIDKKVEALVFEINIARKRESRVGIFKKITGKQNPEILEIPKEKHERRISLPTVITNDEIKILEGKYRESKESKKENSDSDENGIEIKPKEQENKVSEFPSNNSF